MEDNKLQRGKKMNKTNLELIGWLKDGIMLMNEQAIVNLFERVIKEKKLQENKEFQTLIRKLAK